MDAVLATSSVQVQRSQDHYATELVVHTRKVHAFVQHEHRRVREAEGDRRVRDRTLEEAKTGDHVMLKIIESPPKGHSQRFGH